jgi:hypothetical protein
MRTIANWLFALPVPDPDLEYELIAWAAMFLWLANRLEYRSDRLVAVLGVLAAPRRVRRGCAGGGAVSHLLIGSLERNPAVRRSYAACGPTNARSQPT